jgi:SAM-dependent methyltransferase
MNSFDSIQINLGNILCILEKFAKTQRTHTNWVLYNFSKMFYHGVLVKLGIRERFLYNGLILEWLKEFQGFWSKYLKGRPIDFIDFNFLRLFYRVKFQRVCHTNEESEENFLEAWQRPENIYLLFASVWKYAKTNYLDFYKFLKFMPKSGRILEYGSGIAPITKGLLKFLPHRQYRFKICDILQINFLYAIYTVGVFKNVEYEILTPYHNTVNEVNLYDVIICKTVLEHVANPLEVVESFYNSMRPKSLFVFDYVLSSGGGLDSKKSAEQRDSVLDFIENNFEVIYGTIDRASSMDLTVAVKN